MRSVFQRRDREVRKLLLATALTLAVSPALATDKYGMQCGPSVTMHDCLIYSADRGNAHAAMEVAKAYMYGTDTFPHDSFKYVHYLRIAIDKDDGVVAGQAAGLLSIAYSDGEGVPQSYAYALAWAMVSSTLRHEPDGGPSSQEGINILMGMMAPDQIRQGYQIFHNLGENRLHRLYQNRARGLGY